VYACVNAIGKSSHATIRVAIAKKVARLKRGGHIVRGGEGTLHANGVATVKFLEVFSAFLLGLLPLIGPWKVKTCFAFETTS
jgi:hypothetical protein